MHEFGLALTLLKWFVALLALGGIYEFVMAYLDGKDSGYF